MEILRSAVEHHDLGYPFVAFKGRWQKFQTPFKDF
jgi:hypothetical protein